MNHEREQTRPANSVPTRLVPILLLLLASALPLPAAFSPTERPTQAVDPKGCLTDGCHAEVAAYPAVHGPVAGLDCLGCHAVESEADHTFTYWRSGLELCTYCHEFDTGELPVIHEPVLRGECLGCHNPHGGMNRAFLRETTMGATCARCHEDVMRGLAFPHSPAADGECGDCHRPHASVHQMMLDRIGPELCLGCHDRFAEQMDNVVFTHGALDTGCESCHGSHGGEFPASLRASIADTCMACHDDIREHAGESHPHPPVTDERACLTCHTPHGGDLADLLCNSPVVTCKGCHPPKEAGRGVELLTAMMRIGDPERFHHTPVRTGECGGCHLIHGGPQPMLLTGAFPADFYQNPDAADEEGCFQCHDRRLVLEQAAEATRFRNGQENLHFVHVSSGEKGRNCRVCHGIHTSRFPSLIRDRVPYGNWQIETTFEQTGTGGTCLTACHPQLSYDRENPVDLEATGVVTAAPPRPKSYVAPKEMPVQVAWSGQDTAGRLLSIPDRTRPTLLLFLRGDQPHSRKVLEAARALLREHPDTAAAVVLCGEAAEQEAKVFAEDIENRPFATVADPANAFSRSIGILAWPSALVVDANGQLLAHVGGAPPSLQGDLGAYLALARGEIDRIQLRDRLASVDRVSDSPEAGINWSMQLSRRLLSEGNATEALHLLDVSLASHPDSTRLAAQKVRALVQAGQASPASTALRALPPDALPDWEATLLKARILVLQGRWAEARPLAGQLVRDHPELPDVHHLAGSIHEAAGEWPAAAAAYREAFRREQLGVRE